MLAIATLVGVGAWGWLADGARAPQREATVPGRAAAQAMDAPQATPRRWEVRPEDRQLVGHALPNDLRDAFEHVDDLYTYRQRLQASVEQGDVQSAWMVSRIDDYCAGFAQDPQHYDADTRVIAGMGQGASAEMAAARTHVGARCAGFARQSRQPSSATILAQRRTAAQGGNLAAEAALLAMGQPLRASDDYRSDLVKRVRESRDPEAYLALSPAMGAMGVGEDTARGAVSGNQFSELAWQMAACRLGLDCGPDSVLMTTYCANGGICSQDRTQDFPTFVMDAAVPRQGADTINNMVNSLVQGARSEGEGT
ncbi:MAG: hypothetical protein ABW178_10450 [Pseudoxanthomonas sp.]